MHLFAWLHFVFIDFFQYFCLILKLKIPPTKFKKKKIKNMFGILTFELNITDKTFFGNIIFNQNFLKVRGIMSSRHVWNKTVTDKGICQVYDVYISFVHIKHRDSSWVCPRHRCKFSYSLFRFTTWYVFWGDSMWSICHVLFHAHSRPNVLCNQPHLRMFVIS